MAMTFDPDKVRVMPYELMDALEAKNIEAQPVWRPLFEGCKFYLHAEADVVSEWLFETGICLPSGLNMTVAEQGRVIEVLVRELNK